MTYAKNSTIIASDFAVLAGNTTTAEISSISATNKAGALWGVGYGDRGYGQTTFPLSAQVAGSNIGGGNEWRNLQSTLSALANWQATSQANLPPAGMFAAGQPVIAHLASTNPPYDIPAVLTALDANRFNYQITNMAVTLNAATSSAPTAWGTAVKPTITAEFTCTFPSENDARYFFNTGGAIRISMSHPNVTSPQNIAWHDTLNNLNVAFGSHSTIALSGGTGSGTSRGYYEMTTSFQTIYDGTNALGGVYAVNDYYITARAVSIPGVNGAKGSVIIIKVTLTDEHANTYSDTVAAGTNAVIAYLKASTGIVISGPTITTTLDFA